MKLWYGIKLSDNVVNTLEVVSFMTMPGQICLKLVFEADTSEKMVLTRLENSPLPWVIFMVWPYPDQDCLVATAGKPSISTRCAFGFSFITLVRCKHIY